MKLTETSLSYRKSAIEGASSIGLMIALFDTLAGDLRRATAALRQNDIEARSRELNHAALVIGQLESWLDLNNGGESAQTLSRFYAYLRAKMMEAAGTKSPTLLETQIDMILHVRSAWQQLDTSLPQLSVSPGEIPAARTATRASSTYESIPDRIPFSQSA
jgi:flagellar protein FliS